MFATLRKIRLSAHLVLGCLLVGAQLGATLHAFEHDYSTPQAKVCVACVAALQLGSASLDMPGLVALPKQHFDFSPVASEGFDSHAAITARQRGPPGPLQYLTNRR